jgi:hypothetical protein
MGHYETVPAEIGRECTSVTNQQSLHNRPQKPQYWAGGGVALYLRGHSGPSSAHPLLLLLLWALRSYDVMGCGFNLRSPTYPNRT